MNYNYDESHTLAWNLRMMQMRETSNELNNDVLRLNAIIAGIKKDICEGVDVSKRIDDAKYYYDELCSRRDGMLKDIDGMGIGDSDKMFIMSGVLLNLTSLRKYFEEEE